MRFQSYFNTALQIINSHNGSIPLAHYLKQYFAQHKKHGSKDRKYISHLCYCYYRLGHALKNVQVEERLKIALFLCNDNIDEWNVLYDEAWLKHHSSSLNERIIFIKSQYHFDVTDIFPWQNSLSDGIDIKAFCLSHLIQPNLFLRIRPGQKNIVLQKLQQHNIAFTEIDENAVSLPNSTKIEDVIELNREAVVQDYSSQQIQQLFNIAQAGLSLPVSVWDCCAASGGKSILAYDSFDNIELTVSDIRPSIINNLKERFLQAGIKKYKSFIADLTLPASALHLIPSTASFQLIICDVPCTGSGTWARTPEQIYFFTSEKLEHYTAIQQKIVRSIISHVQKDGCLLYITCSVFKKENERMADLIENECKLTLVKQDMIKGYDKKADTMFAALFKK